MRQGRRKERRRDSEREGAMGRTKLRKEEERREINWSWSGLTTGSMDVVLVWESQKRCLWREGM